MASFIKFVEGMPNPKTKTWDVVTQSDARNHLGRVSWFGRWRCYVFFPDTLTVFEKTCLRDIAIFCEEQTRLQRKR